MTAMINPALPRFTDKYRPTTSGCWEWTAGRLSSGYGAFWLDGQMRPAHRVAWEAVNGPIPAGLWIDHLCRNHRCVNPAHLEVVTPGENTLRGTALTRSAEKQRARTHCKNGHPLSGSNLAQRVDHYGRRCRACSAASARRSRARRGEAA